MRSKICIMFSSLDKSLSMNKPPYAGPLSPEELQRQLSEFMRQHFPQGQEPTAAAATGAADTEAPKTDSDQFEFNSSRARSKTTWTVSSSSRTRPRRC